jgi:hypothetical protein
VPVWHERTREWRASGRLVVIGIAQEQHPDRCRLFAQWQGFDWPILWDPFDLTGSDRVPSVVAVDEHGVVRALRPDPSSLAASFLDVDFPAPKEEVAAPVEAGAGLVELARAPDGTFERAHYGALSDLLWRGTERMDAAIETLERQAAERPDDAQLAFRAGVARRLRCDSPLARPEDFQAAIDHWARALALEPNQYIWRRRIQQYGPRMDKPYNFYAWTEEARSAIRARGEEPLALAAELTPAELAEPRREPAADASEASEPDPAGEIRRAPDGWFALESAVAFDTSGEAPVASVHLAFRPAGAVHWNNEVAPMRVWIGSPELPRGWRPDARLLTAPAPAEAVSSEVRRFAFDLAFPAGAEIDGAVRGYALVYACEDEHGECVYVRRDFEVPVHRP